MQERHKFVPLADDIYIPKNQQSKTMFPESLKCFETIHASLSFFEIKMWPRLGIEITGFKFRNAL